MKENECFDIDENIAFKKQLNILRNDFYYKLVRKEKQAYLIDFLYQPLDGISGDAYSVRKIDETKTFFLLIDGMGKGVPASLTTVSVTTFINYYIDKMKKNDTCSLEDLIQETLFFLRPIMLEEEVLSISFLLFDTDEQSLSYAIFSMPPSFLLDTTGKIYKIKSNNPPVSKKSFSFQIDSREVASIEKFLFYTDGLIESETASKELYKNYVQEDFKNSFTKEEMRQKIFSKIDNPEDDITLVFLKLLDFSTMDIVLQKEFETSLESVEKAIEWYESQCVYDCNTIAFNELFMNAYEHGNLGLDAETKHNMLKDDTYIEQLQEHEKCSNKKIFVKVYRCSYAECEYVLTEIEDEGDGFDTRKLVEIFRNTKRFNGRGVYVSKKNSLGIYYNEKGNNVLFINRITCSSAE